MGFTSGRSIQEFWIDFLLEEEFASDTRFTTAFAKGCGLGDKLWTAEKVVHSFSDEFGEADLMVLIAAGMERVGLLIENKITATFQNRQAERYLARGESGKDKGVWTDYRTVLVAPQRYLMRTHGFQHALALEAIVEWVCPDDPKRRAYKIARIGKAIDKKNIMGVQIVDESMTAFRRWYSTLIVDRGCGFIPPADRLAYWGDDWLEWTSGRMPTACRFRHRTKTGVLDLSFAGFAEERLQSLRPFLPERFSIETIGTGKPRGAIMISTAPITDFQDLALAQPTVRFALESAELLQDIVLKHMVWPA